MPLSSRMNAHYVCIVKQGEQLLPSKHFPLSAVPYERDAERNRRSYRLSDWLPKVIIEALILGKWPTANGLSWASQRTFGCAMAGTALT